ncbi:MAG TPA: hypothetical protein VFK01_11280 [Bradyrhizobium sp.]|nr:hypothetical protein [Bradyrhizobium sp.]
MSNSNSRFPRLNRDKAQGRIGLPLTSRAEGAGLYLRAARNFANLPVRFSGGHKKAGTWARLFAKKFLKPCLVPGQSEAPPGLKSYFLDFFDFLAFFAFFAFFAFLAIASSSELMD